MSRDLCDMYTTINGERYCDYFDYGCYKCKDVIRCPDKLDEGDDYEDEEGCKDEPDWRKE